MGKDDEYDEKDAARETDSSLSEVAENWHKARDDAEDYGCFERGNDEKNSTPFSKDELPDGGADSFWDSIFGGKK